MPYALERPSRRGWRAVASWKRLFIREVETILAPDALNLIAVFVAGGSKAVEISFDALDAANQFGFA